MGTTDQNKASIPSKRADEWEPLCCGGGNITIIIRGKKKKKKYICLHHFHTHTRSPAALNRSFHSGDSQGRWDAGGSSGATTR